MMPAMLMSQGAAAAVTGIRNPLTGGAINNSSPGATTQETDFIPYNNGTIQFEFAPNGVGQGQFIQENWYTPTTALIGAFPQQYWVKLVKNSGSLTVAGNTLNSYFNFASSGTSGILWTCTGIGTASITVSISNTNNDSGIVTTGTYTITNSNT